MSTEDDHLPTWYTCLALRLRDRLSPYLITALKSPAQMTVEVASQIRDALINVSKELKSDEDRAHLCQAIKDCILPHQSILNPLLNAVAKPHWPLAERLDLQRCAGFAGVEHVIKTLSKVDLTAQGTIRTQEYFLSVWAHPKAAEGLRQVYAIASWPEVRGALRRLTESEHRVAIPLLVEIAAKADPTIQKEICDALARIGDPSGEPLLMTLITHGDPGRTMAAAQALGVVGSRRALPILNETLAAGGSRKEVVEALTFAIQSIQEREGLQAAPGAVSLAADQGGLSVFDESTAALYETVSESVAAQTPERWVPRENKNPWAKLLPAPRTVPLMVKLDMLASVSPITMLGAGWLGAVLTGLGVELLQDWFMGVHTAADTPTLHLIKAIGSLGVGLVALYFPYGLMVSFAVKDMRALAKGDLVLAEVESYSVREKLNGKTRTTYHCYEVVYVDADGEHRRSSRESLDRWGSLDQGDLAPLFVLPDAAFTSAYEYGCIGLNDDGELVYVGWKDAWFITFMWLNAAAQLAYILY